MFDGFLINYFYFYYIAIIIYIIFFVIGEKSAEQFNEIKAVL